MDDVIYGSSSDEWGTPPALFHQIEGLFGQFTLDPCANRRNRKVDHWFGDRTNDGHQPIFNRGAFVDGLGRDWKSLDGGRANVFVNPPFSRKKKMYVEPWVLKAILEVDRGHAEQVVMLIPARTDVAYWHDLVFPSASVIFFLRGRVSFTDPVGGITLAPAPFPSAVVMFDRGFPRRPHIATLEQGK